jgi:hypothetical protein
VADREGDRAIISGGRIALTSLFIVALAVVALDFDDKESHGPSVQLQLARR